MAISRSLVIRIGTLCGQEREYLSLSHQSGRNGRRQDDVSFAIRAAHFPQEKCQIEMGRTGWGIEPRCFCASTATTMRPATSAAVVFCRQLKTNSVRKWIRIRGRYTDASFNSQDELSPPYSVEFTPQVCLISEYYCLGHGILATSRR